MTENAKTGEKRSQEQPAAKKLAGKPRVAAPVRELEVYDRSAPLDGILADDVGPEGSEDLSITFQIPGGWGALRRARIISGPAPRDATFQLTWQGQKVAMCVNNRRPDRLFKAPQPATVAFATLSCVWGNFIPIRGNPTAYGWLFQVDANQDNTWVMQIEVHFQA